MAKTTSQRRTVAVTGASGAIGSRLCRALAERGDEVVRLVRTQPGPGERRWTPGATLGPEVLHDIDAVIHLAGANIGAGRWTQKRRRNILQSRVEGTRSIAEAVAAAEPQPVLVSMSAVGYYGDCGEAVVDESSPAGDLWLSEVCKQWEAAARPAADAGAHVVHPRMAVVLDSQAGALQKMLLPARFGLGGPIGSGQQYLPWIAAEDAVAALVHLSHATVTGPVNVAAPHAVTQKEFAQTLSKVLHRPSFLPLPVFAVRLLFGQMGQEMLVKGQRVSPQRLLDSGFTPSFPGLEGALQAVLAAKQVKG